jgi:hypothetical protein
VLAPLSGSPASGPVAGIELVGESQQGRPFALALGSRLVGGEKERLGGERPGATIGMGRTWNFDPRQ